MKKSAMFLLVSFIMLFIAVSVNAGILLDSSDTKIMLVNKWSLNDLKINGNTTDSPAYIFELKADGSYTQVDDGEVDNGTWVLSDDGKAMIFDKGTEDEETWNIISIVPDKLVITFTDEGNKFILTFVPVK